MSEHEATVTRKNFLLTGKNLGTDPRLKVGGDLTGWVRLTKREIKHIT